MSSPSLKLYYFDSCPFCQIVIQAIDRLGLAVEMNDIIANEDHLRQLLNDTGRRTVPCLYIDGNPMHESADIVRWLQDNQAKLKKRS
jgi:glutaredoxin 3